MNKDLFDTIRDLFFTGLERKTGWGKEEIKKLYLESTASAALFYIDMEQAKPTAKPNASEDSSIPVDNPPHNDGDAPWD